jgi:hypothetical protein
MLDQLAGSGVGTDWGARMLSRESELYEPLSYNNGAVWPFLTEFAALALYRHHRAHAGWAYLDGTADLTFLEARGYIAELFSGDRLRSIDAAVPHQLFATTGYVSTLLRGMLGLSRAGDDPLAARMRIAPQLPPGWSFVRAKNLRWRDAVVDVSFERTGDGSSVRVTPKSGTAPLSLELTLPPGAELLSSSSGRRFSAIGGDTSRGVRLRLDADFSSTETIHVRHRPGIEIAPIHEALQVGDESRRLRIIDARLEQRTFSVRVQGRSGRAYRLRLDSPFLVTSLDGARDVGADGTSRILEVTFPQSSSQWSEAAIRAKLGARR